MRLVGIVATCIILLATLLYGFQHRLEVGQRLAEGLETVLPATLATVDAQDLPDADGRHATVIPMLEGGRLVMLDSFPGYARTSFALPQGVNLRAGTLTLELGGAVEEGARGTLRITVNGVARTELLLEGGPVRRRVQVPLNPRDLAGREVVVSLAAQGRARQEDCTAEWTGGLVVQVLPASHLVLDLDAPLTDPADLLLTQGAPLLLQWPQEATLRAVALRAAHHAMDRGDVVHLTSEAGRGLVASHALLTALQARIAPDRPPQAAPEDLLVALGTRRTALFNGEAQWRLPFDRRRMEGAGVASALELQMVFDAAGGDAGWLLTVRLNDRLVHSEGLETAAGTLMRLIPLPTDAQPIENDLRVTLTSAEMREGACMSHRPATADIQRARLTIAPPVAQDAWAGLMPLLSERLALWVHDDVQGNGAQLALGALNALRPGRALDLIDAPLADAADPRIGVLPTNTLPRHLAGIARATSWVVLPDAEGEGGIVLLRADQIDARSLVDAPRAVLLIEAHPRALHADARR